MFFARGEELPEERTLAAALVGGVVAGSLQGGAARALDFFDAKALAEGAAAALGLALRVCGVGAAGPALEPGASATVSVAGRPVGPWARWRRRCGSGSGLRGRCSCWSWTWGR